jgi:hypothetical protein
MRSTNCADTETVENSYRVDKSFSSDESQISMDLASECFELLQELTTCPYSELTCDILAALQQSQETTVQTVRNSMPNQSGLALLPTRKRQSKQRKLMESIRQSSTPDRNIE